MIEIAAIVSISILILAVVLALIRMTKGPSLPDKVVTLDLIWIIGMGIFVAFIFWKERPMLTDIVLIISLLLFFGTVTIAKYLKKREDNDS